MSAENKTEQATPQRRQKAREQGQVPRSREFSGALAICAVLTVMTWQGGTAISQWRHLLALLLDRAAQGDVGIGSLQLSFFAWMGWATPPILSAFAIAGAASFAQGGPVFSWNSLSPNAERLSPGKKTSQLFSSSTLSSVLKSLVPFAFIAVIAYRILLRDLEPMATTTFGTVHGLAGFILTRCYELAWKSALVLLVWSGVEYLLIRLKHERDLRMSRQEVREEAKESEGNPQIKAKIRRMQRQMGRKQMLRDVQRATVVVTNPTHFAIALEYTAEIAAPVVVAKGQNIFAQQIKQAASWHGVPMVENPPLAHALYRTVEVGQAIPAKLYSAVAEILALVYRAQQRVASREGGWR